MNTLLSRCTRWRSHVPRSSWPFLPFWLKNYWLGAGGREESARNRELLRPNLRQRSPRVFSRAEKYFAVVFDEEEEMEHCFSAFFSFFRGYLEGYEGGKEGRSKGNAKEDFVANFFMLHRYNLFSNSWFERYFRDGRRVKENYASMKEMNCSSYVILCINFSRKTLETVPPKCIISLEISEWINFARFYYCEML